MRMTLFMRHGKKLSEDEIKYFVTEYTKGAYLIIRHLFFNGHCDKPMDKEETCILQVDGEFGRY